MTAGQLARFHVPLRVESALNMREHWGKRSRRVKAERAATALVCLRLKGFFPRDADLVVTLTRVAPGTLDDDNLASSLKGVRDELAVLLGRDDAPGSGVEWSYAQIRGRRAAPKQGRVTEYGVDIEVRHG